MTQTTPGKLGTGPRGPAGPPYGRTEYGTVPKARGRNPRAGKGVNQRSARRGRPSAACRNYGYMVRFDGWMELVKRHPIFFLQKPKHGRAGKGQQGESNTVLGNTSYGVWSWMSCMEAETHDRSAFVRACAWWWIHAREGIVKR